MVTGNAAAVTWCDEVNARRHGETSAVPTGRLATERDLLTALPSLQLRIGPSPVTRKVDRLATIRFGSARYSVPMRLTGASLEVVVDGDRLLLMDPATGEVVADHPVVPPGEASVTDAHYGGPRPAPRRSLRPRSVAEKQFCALGPAAVAFITGAAAAGHTRLVPSWRSSTS